MEGSMGDDTYAYKYKFKVGDRVQAHAYFNNYDQDAHYEGEVGEIVGCSATYLYVSFVGVENKKLTNVSCWLFQENELTFAENSSELAE
jgi:ribosomal protein L21E